jgi:hypothetical protein
MSYRIFPKMLISVNFGENVETNISLSTLTATEF